MFQALKQRARLLKRDAYTLYYAYRDPRTPWYAKIFAGLVAAYAFSPIDLIPDFIPILGYLDDLILIPLGVVLAMKMIPGAVITDSRATAESQLAGKKPVSWVGLAIMIVIWIVVLLLVGIFVWKKIQAL
jgi:uncharacterized membrane protein YkvA (DUF1232 family)